MIYRQKVESIKGVLQSGEYCVICGWSVVDWKGRSLVEGAHVRPYKNVPDYDLADNIIGLCPNHHTEFDAGNITINCETGLVTHIDKHNQYHNRQIVGTIKHIKIGYFDYNYKHIFKGAL